VAYLPCTNGAHVHRGRNANVYVTILSGNEDVRRSGRVCPVHWAEINSWLSKHEVDPITGAARVSVDEMLCISCEQPVTERGRQLFSTCYPAKNERKDYWARICDTCSLPAPIQAGTTPE